MNRLEKAAIISTVANALIALVKFIVGSLFGSIALIADAFHSFTDIVGSIAVFFGIRFSKIKSKQFPYGLYKLENLISLFVSLLIFYAAFEIFVGAIGKISHPARMAPIMEILPIGAAIFSLIISIFLFKYKEIVGKEENSPSMIAEARHTRIDVLSTFGVLIALGLSFFGFAFFDPLIGLIIALLVFKAGVDILVSSSKVLLDVSLDYKTMGKIEGIIKQQKDLELVNLIARNSGRYVFVEMKLGTKIKDLKKVTQLHRQCEEKIKKAIPRIDSILTDIEYKKKAVLRYAVPVMEKREEAQITPGFGFAPFFALLDLKNEPKKKLLKIEFIANPHTLAERRKGILAAEMLAKKGVDVLLSREEMKKSGAYYALTDYYIEIELTKKDNLKELLNEFR